MNEPEPGQDDERYWYFVHFKFGEGRDGNAEVSTPGPIATIQDLEAVSDLLRVELRYQSLVLCNFQLLRVETYNVDVWEIESVPMPNMVLYTGA